MPAITSQYLHTVSLFRHVSLTVDILSHQSKEKSLVSADLAGGHTDELAHINLKSVLIGKLPQQMTCLIFTRKWVDRRKNTIFSIPQHGLQ